MAQVLELQFLTAHDKAVTISIQNPKQDLTDAQVLAAMQTIIDQNVFAKEDSTVSVIKGARIVERVVTDFDMN